MISLFKVYMSENVADAVKDVLNSGYIGQGPLVDRFEEKLKSRLQTDYVITTNSATSAEHLALHMLKKPTKHQQWYNGVAMVESKWPGIQEGDEVLTTSLTCTATNWPILANGMDIKWVDVDTKTLNMDLDDLERKITPKTKVIMAMHWGGYPLDLDKLKEIQQRAYKKVGFKPAIIEDCAHAFGSTFNGKPIGSHGNICTFSFQAIKHLTSVDGGCLVVPHKELNDRAKLLRWYGIDRTTNQKDFRCETNISEWGFKFHMNDVNARIGLENLKEVDENVISKHKDNAKYYDENLRDVDGITLLERDERMNSASWIYSLLVNRKQDFMNYMKECNIMVSQVHERNDIHSCVSEYVIELPNLDKIRNNIISIPGGWWVTNNEREYVVNCIKKGW